jgi:hypothetical protein
MPYPAAPTYLAQPKVEACSAETRAVTGLLSPKEGATQGDVPDRKNR